MAEQAGQIRGWKSIGAHFGRDRSTAIPWANERGLPVHRIPGGKTGTVYALRAGLDAWAASSGAESESVDAGLAGATPARPRGWRRLSLFAWVVIAAAILAATAAGRLIQQRLPANPDVAALYLDARDAWVQADAASLAKSISQYESVISQDPQFARAHAGLAEAYLLSGEYGALSYDVAFGRAKRSAEQALAIDGDLAAAHRALAYIAYWWERDPSGPVPVLSSGDRTGFRRLVDAFLVRRGAVRQRGIRRGGAGISRCAPGSPGSVAVDVHRARLEWLKGNTAAGLALLGDIAARVPDDALSRYFLAIATVGEGDFVRYLRIMRERDRLRGEPQHSADLVALEAARLTSRREAALKSC